MTTYVVTDDVATQAMVAEMIPPTARGNAVALITGNGWSEADAIARSCLLDKNARVLLIVEAITRSTADLEARREFMVQSGNEVGPGRIKVVLSSADRPGDAIEPQKRESSWVAPLEELVASDAVSQFLLERGWSTQSEVSLGGRHVDLVGTKGERTLLVELKRHITTAALSQLAAYRYFVPDAAIALAVRSPHEPSLSPSMVKQARSAAIAVWRVLPWAKGVQQIVAMNADFLGEAADTPG